VETPDIQRDRSGHAACRIAAATVTQLPELRRRGGSRYTAHFTARIADTTTFGAAHVVDTASFAGGGGLATGTTKLITLPTPPSAVPITERVTVEITSDAAPGVLGKCDFDLTVRGFNEDLDGDGISNDVEIRGLRDSAGDLVKTADGKPASDFPALGANPCRKDLFIQLRYQVGANGHSHRPDPAARAKVQNAFANAPVPGVRGGCPFAGFASGSGIHLGIDIGDPLPTETVTGTPSPPLWHRSTATASPTTRSTLRGVRTSSTACGFLKPRTPGTARHGARPDELLLTPI
jgi:hypothetical protein